jgi:hypothetical protein
MSLFTKFIQAVQSLRRRRDEPKSRRRTVIRLEQLDHRQLLAVSFSGNVTADFPVNATSGVFSVQDNPSLSPPVVHPIIPGSPSDPTSLKSIIKVSGLDINGIRLLYTPSDDTLSIGLLQPLNQKPDATGTQFPVIAGDTDNNGNNGTVDPAVLAVTPTFLNPPALGGSQTMGAFLDLGGTGNVNTDNPNDFIVAGISNDFPVDANKSYLVSKAIVDPNDPNAIPDFPVDAAHVLPNNTGNFYLGATDPRHGALEMQITHFSQLYQQITGKPLTSTSLIQVGAFGNSNDDDGISEAFFPLQPFTLAQGTQPPPPPPVPTPPVSPPVQINPHSARHVNTAHSETVRVTIFSTSGFNATQINPATVRLGGATPFTEFTRVFKGNEFPAETFVFKGLDIHLPPGITVATVTGQTFAGTQFSTSELIFNKDDSFYTIDQIDARNAHLGITTTLPTTFNVLDQALISSTYQSALAQLEAIQATAAQQAAASAASQAAMGITTAADTSMTSQVVSNASLSQPVPAQAVAATSLTSAMAPQTVSIPTRRQAAATARASVPTTVAAGAFTRAAARQSAAATAAASRAAATQARVAAHDAALQSMASQQPQTSSVQGAF